MKPNLRKQIKNKNVPSLSQEMQILHEENLLQLQETKDILPRFVHELKNPLVAIHMQLQLLENYSSEIKEETLQAKIRKKVIVIQREISSLSSQLQEFLLATSQMNKKKEEANINQFSLNTLIEELCSLLAPQIEKNNIHLKLNLINPIYIQGIEPIKIKQILLNLFLNAIQAFKTRSSIIKQIDCIEISSLEADESFYIKVNDNAGGMSEEVQKRIFEPYYTTKEKGSGLGLNIVSKMITELNGRLDIDSRKNEGSTFIISLPKKYLSLPMKIKNPISKNDT